MELFEPDQGGRFLQGPQPEMESSLQPLQYFHLRAGINPAPTRLCHKPFASLLAFRVPQGKLTERRLGISLLSISCEIASRP